MLTSTNGGAHWVRTPLTTRVSQTSLLLVSLSWGISYCIPEQLRVSFSEVYPPSLTKHTQVPMWCWGALMIVAAVMALVGERMILAKAVSQREPSYVGWHMSVIAHIVLAAIYFTLLCGALVTGFVESAGSFPGIVSALSRPILWGYIAAMHVTYSRLPSPFPPSDTPKKKKKGKLKLFTRESVESDGPD